MNNSVKRGVRRHARAPVDHVWLFNAWKSSYLSHACSLCLTVYLLLLPYALALNPLVEGRNITFTICSPSGRLPKRHCFALRFYLGAPQEVGYEGVGCAWDVNKKLGKCYSTEKMTDKFNYWSWPVYRFQSHPRLPLIRPVIWFFITSVPTLFHYFCVYFWYDSPS